MKSTFVVRGEYIQLDQLLKVAGLVTTGGEAHAAVAAGLVKVDGKVEGRKRAKLRAGQGVSYAGHNITLVADQG
ncbi:MAG: RNA-binding S4 domain-containing protein [Rhodocyclales bacterium]|nr:RNA-binding S4 domain-containing protein [Rhodocyclales bacterium]